jgi:hypothetical protein
MEGQGSIIDRMKAAAAVGRTLKHWIAVDFKSPKAIECILEKVA